MGDMKFPVAGSGYDNRASIVRRFCRRGDAVRLVREPGNPVDSFAVAVWHVRIGKDGIDKGDQIGYVPYRLAARLAPVLDRDLFAVKSAQIESCEVAHDGDQVRVLIRAEIDGWLLEDQDEPPINWSEIKLAYAKSIGNREARK